MLSMTLDDLERRIQAGTAQSSKQKKLEREAKVALNKIIVLRQVLVGNEAMNKNSLLDAQIKRQRDQTITTTTEQEQINNDLSLMINAATKTLTLYSVN